MRQESTVRILLIEDDMEICEILQFYLLTNTDYELTIVHSAEQAMPLAQKRPYQLILLDIMLPGMDGISFCQELRKTSFCPIIFISCLSDDKTIIRALNMGGDDYLTKPFEAAVLHARIEANLRRCRPEPAAVQSITNGALELFPADHKLTKNGAAVELSPTEYAIIDYMLRHAGEYISFDTLYREIWRRSSYGDFRALFVHITHLRQKLEDDPAHPRYIRTHMRSGYIFGVES